MEEHEQLPVPLTPDDKPSAGEVTEAGAVELGLDSAPTSEVPGPKTPPPSNLDELAAESKLTQEEPPVPVEGDPSAASIMAVPASDVQAPIAPEPSARIYLDHKHPLAIRWMHWINFPVLFTMIWSGLLIYWNDSDNAYHHPHAVYRVGLGSFTLFRFFPDWFWKGMNAPYHVTVGLGYHFFFMWLFAINGLLWTLYTLFSGEWRYLFPNSQSVREAIQVTLVDLHLHKGLPPQKKYNGAQKIAYTSMMIMGAGSLLTGLAIYKPTQLHWITSALGGYEMARWEHFLLTLGFCGFFVIHIAQVMLAGWNNFRSMVSGYEIAAVDKPSLETERRSW